LNNIVTWNLGRGHSVKGHSNWYTIRKLWCGFPFAFHNNYGSILHHVRDKARYWSKIVIFHIPCIRRRSPSEYCHPVWYGKLEWSGYLTVKKLWWCLSV